MCTKEGATDALVAEVDPAELAIRMCEAAYCLKRPKPSAIEALSAMDEGCREGWMRAAISALEYLNERLAAATGEAEGGGRDG